MKGTEEVFRQRQYFEFVAHMKWGWEFQHLFERLMMRTEPGFIPVRPQGRLGDWKCDGYSHRTSRFFQVYAPRFTKSKVAVQKAEEDLVYVLENWPEDTAPLREWIFVYGHHDVYPALRTEILKIAQNRGIKIIEWNLQDIWNKFLELSRDSRLAVLQMPGEWLTDDSRKLDQILSRLPEAQGKESQEKKSWTSVPIQSTPSYRVTIDETKGVDGTLWFLFEMGIEVKEFLVESLDKIHREFNELCSWGRNKSFQWLHRSNETLLKGHYWRDDIGFLTTTHIRKLSSASFELSCSLSRALDGHWLSQSLVGLLGKTPVFPLEENTIVDGGRILIKDPKKPHLTILVNLKDLYAGMIANPKYEINFQSTDASITEYCTSSGQRVLSFHIRSNLGSFERIAQIIGPNVIQPSETTSSDVRAFDVGWNGDGLEIRIWINAAEPDGCIQDCTCCPLFLKGCNNAHYWQSVNLKHLTEELEYASVFLPADSEAELLELVREEMSDTLRVILGKKEREKVSSLFRQIADARAKLNEQFSKLLDYCRRIHLMTPRERRNVSDLARVVRHRIERGGKLADPRVIGANPKYMDLETFDCLMEDYGVVF